MPFLYRAKKFIAAFFMKYLTVHGILESRPNGKITGIRPAEIECDNIK
jgi:hypothetical protein